MKPVQYLDKVSEAAQGQHSDDLGEVVVRNEPPYILLSWLAARARPNRPQTTHFLTQFSYALQGYPESCHLI